MRESQWITWTVIVGVLAAFVVALLAIFSAGCLWAMEQAETVQPSAFEIGSILAGVITGAILAILATVSQLVLAFLAYKKSAQSVKVSVENKEAIAEVKKTGEQTKKTGEETKDISATTEGIVNSQRTAMTKEIHDLTEGGEDSRRQIQDLKQQIISLQENLSSALQSITAKDTVQAQATKGPVRAKKKPNRRSDSWTDSKRSRASSASSSS